MSVIIQLPWLARNLEVTESTDPTLVGLSGVVPLGPQPNFMKLALGGPR